MKPVPRFLLCFLLAGLYILSGVLKLIPAEYFENDLQSLGFGSDLFVMILARVIIASEFIIGGMLLFQVWLKQALLLSLVMLVLYSVFLLWLIGNRGNEGSCGCFGHEVEMTPAQGILKHVGM